MYVTKQTSSLHILATSASPGQQYLTMKTFKLFKSALFTTISTAGINMKLPCTEMKEHQQHTNVLCKNSYIKDVSHYTTQVSDIFAHPYNYQPMHYTLSI
jgi:hypothetical protein